MMRKSILLLAIILFGTIALAEPEAFFDNAQINDMIGENYAQVLGQGGRFSCPAIQPYFRPVTFG